MNALAALLLAVAPSSDQADAEARAILAIVRAREASVTQPVAVVTRPANVSPKPAKRNTYPQRSQSGRTWTGCPDWRHLTTGEHAGQFDADWLRTLDAKQLQALHADSHEGRVQWQFVQRPARTPPAVVCPDGRCPVRRVYRVR